MVWPYGLIHNWEYRIDDMYVGTKMVYGQFEQNEKKIANSV